LEASDKTVAERMTDRYRGCLLGLACGDALGGPVEFKSRDEIARHWPDGLREFVGGGWLNLTPGEITDDTQMTVALAESLAAHPELDMDDVGARFVAWLKSNPKDVGATTRRALGLLALGASWREAGEQAGRGGQAAGNGTVMRCAPVALRFRSDSARLRRASIDTAAITHVDPRCTWGAVAVNQAIAHLLDGGSKETVAAAAIEGVENDDVRRAVLDAAERDRADVKSGGFVLDTIGAAFWCLARHDEFENAVVAAVALGDDADTTGAVAGALAGACFGASAIPARWRDLLEPRAELERLADQLLTLSLAAETPRIPG
jgi:ADP-ribosyl-[dinitrogen reductase] hydrolase